jgi:DNA-binding beta-propeller fold protein YncE
MIVAWLANHVNFANDRNGRFAYVTVGGSNEVKVYRRDGATPTLVATIPVGDLPRGLWPNTFVSSQVEGR